MNKNIIKSGSSLKDALSALNELVVKANLTLFVVDENRKLLATLTDGDIRRGLLKGNKLEDPIELIMNRNFRFIRINEIDSKKLKEFRDKEILLVPVLDEQLRIVKILNLTAINGFIPVDAVIMAGGEGARLKPLTIDIPKPLLKVGGKPIIEHNIDRLAAYGVDSFCISVKYQAQKIKEYLLDGQSKGINIHYITEGEPMGTIGALKLIQKFQNQELLVMNSDLLTNIDFEDFYSFFKLSNADMAVATTSYNVNVPYAIVEVDNDTVKSLKEKPTYTYYSNAGIYLLKRGLIDLIPSDTFYNATDLMEAVIAKKMKLVSYPILGYWLDIGSPADYAKAQEDIKHIKLS